MSDNTVRKETLVDKKVAYYIEVDGRLFLIEKRPRRALTSRTCQKLFSPETVERLQQIVRK